MDAIKSFGESLPSYQRQSSTAMLMPPNMKTFPLYISALLKSDAFRYIWFSICFYIFITLFRTEHVEADYRTFSLQDIKQQPSRFSRQHWHPDLYRVDNLSEFKVEKRERCDHQYGLYSKSNIQAATYLFLKSPYYRYLASFFHVKQFSFSMLVGPFCY